MLQQVASCHSASKG